MLSALSRRQLISAARISQRLSAPSPILDHRPSLRAVRHIFIIRSGTPQLFTQCVQQLRSLAPRATLHVVSHERDKELIANICRRRYIFYPYPGGGSYSWEGLAVHHTALRAAGLQAFVMLTNSVYGYPHIAHILYQLGAQQLHLFNVRQSWTTLTRAELEFKSSAAAIYNSICHFFYTQDAR